jgi:hypothetical protein
MAKDDTSDPIVSALWTKVLDRWDEDEVHEAFIDHCLGAGQMPEAARRYREHGEAAEGDDSDEVQEEVERRLAAIRAKALATMDLHRAPSEPRRGCRRAMNVLSVLLFLAVLLLIGLILR